MTSPSCSPANRRPCRRGGRRTGTSPPPPPRIRRATTAPPEATSSPPLRSRARTAPSTHPLLCHEYEPHHLTERKTRHGAPERPRPRRPPERRRAASPPPDTPHDSPRCRPVSVRQRRRWSAPSGPTRPTREGDIEADVTSHTSAATATQCSNDQPAATTTPRRSRRAPSPSTNRRTSGTSFPAARAGSNAPIRSTARAARSGRPAARNAPPRPSAAASPPPPHPTARPAARPRQRVRTPRRAGAHRLAAPLPRRGRGGVRGQSSQAPPSRSGLRGGPRHRGEAARPRVPATAPMRQTP